MSMRPIVIAIGLLIVAAPLSARNELRLGNARPVSAPVQGPAAMVQNSPVIATDGSDFLVAWADDRSPRVARYTIVKSNGEITSPAGNLTPVNGAPLAAFWTGEFYVLIIDNFSTFVRISASGTLLDEQPQILGFRSGSAGLTFQDVVFWNDAIYFFARTSGAESKLYVYRFRFGETYWGMPTEVPLPSGESNFHITAARTDGAILPIAWYGETETPGGVTRAIRTAHLDKNLRVIPESERVVGDGVSGVGSLAIATDGTRDLVTYNDPFGPLIGKFVTESGVEEHGMLIADTNAAPLASRQILSANGRFMATYVRLDRTPSVLRESVIEYGAGVVASYDLSGEAGVKSWSPVVAMNHDRILVSWSEAGDVKARFVESDGTPSERPPSAGFVLTMSAASQFEAAVAAGMPGYLVAWTESRSEDPNRLLATKVNEAGIAQGGGIPLLETNGRFTRLKIVFDGSRFLVFANEETSDSRVVAAAVDADGNVESLGVVATLSESAPYDLYDVASHAGVELVVWNESRNGVNAIVGTLLANGKTVTPIPFVIADAVYPQVDASVAADESGFVVVWTEYVLNPDPPPCPFECPPDPGTPRVRRVHLDLDMTAGQSEIVRDLASTPSIGGAEHLRLLTFDDRSDFWNLAGKVDGSSAAEIRIADSRCNLKTPVTWDGENLALVECDVSGDTWTFVPRLKRVSPDGALLEGSISLQGYWFSIASLGKHAGIFAFTREIDGVPRIFVRSFVDGDLPARRRGVSR